MENRAVAIYIRLSVEDSKTDSLSIEGQRKIITKHLKIGRASCRERV